MSLVKVVRTVIQVAVFCLGVFEFVHLYEMVATDETKLIAKLQGTNIYPPAVVSDAGGRLLLSIFLFFLGLLRVTFAISPMKGMSAWLSIVFTHVGEGLFFWNLALLPHFNKAGLSLPELFQQVIQNKIECDHTSRVILLAVPIVAVICFLHGPEFPAVEKKSKKN